MIERVLWPEAGITKLELARYYEAIAPRFLAQAGNRRIGLVRCPNGAGGQSFFQRQAIAAATLALMCSNWALRSGWSWPSSVLRLAWRL